MKINSKIALATLIVTIVGIVLSFYNYKDPDESLSQKTSGDSSPIFNNIDGSVSINKLKRQQMKKIIFILTISFYTLQSNLHAENLEQNTSGDFSPAINNVQGNVTINLSKEDKRDKISGLYTLCSEAETSFEISDKKKWFDLVMAIYKNKGKIIELDIVIEHYCQDSSYSREEKKDKVSYVYMGYPTGMTMEKLHSLSLDEQEVKINRYRKKHPITDFISDKEDNEFIELFSDIGLVFYKDINHINARSVLGINDENTADIITGPFMVKQQYWDGSIAYLLSAPPMR